jgi:hypothetical protein
MADINCAHEECECNIQDDKGVRKMARPIAAVTVPKPDSQKIPTSVNAGTRIASDCRTELRDAVNGQPRRDECSAENRWPLNFSSAGETRRIYDRLLGRKHNLNSRVWLRKGEEDHVCLTINVPHLAWKDS